MFAVVAVVVDCDVDCVECVGCVVDIGAAASGDSGGVVSGCVAAAVCCVGVAGVCEGAPAAGDDCVVAVAAADDGVVCRGGAGVCVCAGVAVAGVHGVNTVGDGVGVGADAGVDEVLYYDVDYCAGDCAVFAGADVGGSCVRCRM